MLSISASHFHRVKFYPDSSKSFYEYGRANNLSPQIGCMQESHAVKMITPKIIDYNNNILQPTALVKRQ